MAEPVARGRLGARVDALPLHAVEEEGEGPLAVGAALDEEEPGVRERGGEGALDGRPGRDAAVVHEHQRAVPERVAVGVRERAGGGRAHVGEDQGRRRLRREAGQVDAVPRRDSGGEEAGGGAEGGGGVIADAEAVAVVGAAGVLGGNGSEVGVGDEWFERVG